MNPVFLDCEASSLHRLDSYPIEVAWGFPNGEVESHLIDPAAYPADWLDWDPAAQAVHGLSRAYLRAHGQAPEDLAEAIEQALAGQAVYSDAPAFDNFWLRRLFQAVERDCPIECRPIEQLLRPLLPAHYFYFDLENNAFSALEPADAGTSG